MVLNVYGHVRVQDNRVWLHVFLEKLTAQQEASFSQPWRLADAPEDYLQNMLKAIVGIELVITRWEGKWKLSQNKVSPEYQGVIAGLSETQVAESMALAATMQSLKPAH
ncbi:FMN-binding negative transcriptional regulator [uncultured Thiothrix sp.]|uniref:FMN-binding negative transcriptional regulator n=1 Tax=uncultured Thiothrix sp. TaxID=223185 RepID=UPI0026030DB8|nr:FMN-binding negative transcriptional regulator [uncultured Thiothrix sp.]HMT92832.1 FMN-binding negative transcriptional regulator [Thiolinea sp.]